VKTCSADLLSICKKLHLLKQSVQVSFSFNSTHLHSEKKEWPIDLLGVMNLLLCLCLPRSSPKVVITVSFSFCRSHLRSSLCVLFSLISFYHQPVVAKKTHLLLNILVKVRIHYWFVCLHHNLCSIIFNPTVPVDFFSASQRHSGRQTALLSPPSRFSPFFLSSSTVTIIAGCSLGWEVYFKTHFT